MDETASLLLFGIAVIGAMVLLMALVAFLPVIVQLLFGYFSNPEYRKHPGFWKLWARYRLKITWSNFAGAMWKKRNDDEFITLKFKEELKEYAKRGLAKKPSTENSKAKKSQSRSYMKYLAAEIKDEWPPSTKAKTADKPLEKESFAVKTKKNDDDPEKFPALLNAQLVALHISTGDPGYREAFDRRLEAAGIMEQQLKEAVFNFILGIIKTQHKEVKLSDPSFVTSSIFNLILPALPKTTEEYLSEDIFTPSEVVKIFDEAEWRYWNNHEQKMPDEIWGEIFRHSRHGDAKLMTGMMDRLEKLSLSTDQVGAMLRNDQVIIGNYKWAGRPVKPEDTGSTLSAWEAGAKVCDRLNSDFTFHEDGTAVIKKYRGNDGKVAVPTILDGYRVTGVGDYAFMNAMYLSYVFLPEGITDIGVDAFTNTRGNKVTVTLPKSLARIRGNPFSELCAHIVIPPDHPQFVLADGVLFDKVDRKLISFPYQGRPRAWFNAEKTGETYEVPRGTRAIGDQAFSHAHSLFSILLPKGLHSIGDYAFHECENLANLTLPKGIKHIGNRAFTSCSSLASITLPDSLTEMGANPFTWISIEINLSEHHPRFALIGGVLFDKVEKRLISYPYGNKNKEYRIPEHILCIGESAFQNCSSLISVTLPVGLLSIGAVAFCTCKALEHLSFPKGLRSIGNSAFEHCSSLSSADLSEGPTSIGNSAFAWCENLASLTLPRGLESIGDYAFSHCPSLSSLTLPDGLQSIGDNAFKDCSGLTSLVLPEGLQSIGESAFQDCIGLTSLVLPEGLERIGSFSFNSCTGLTSLTLPAGLKSIENYAFASCRNLVTITLPEGLARIGNSVFLGCGGLTALNIPDSLEEMGAFPIESPDFSLAISPGNPYFFLADGMLYNKKSACLVVCLDKSDVEAVSLPHWIKAIGGRAFYGCTNLVDVTMPEGLERIEDDAFHACVGLTALTLPRGLVSIGENAFYACSSLTNILLPEGLESVGMNAFFECKNLQSIYVPASVTYIGHMAFSPHSSLKLTVERGSYAEAWSKRYKYPFETLASSQT